jgi:hypothetical protein
VPALGRISRFGPTLRARSWVYASPPGLVLSSATCVDPGPKGPSPTHGRTPNTPWEGGKRASCAGGPGHSVRSRRRPP